MKKLTGAVDSILIAQQNSGKPLAVILAGHNGSGKSTMWYKHLSSQLQIPLINADRMMRSILPDEEFLPTWAKNLRDSNIDWMQTAQKGVESFMQHACERKLAFAMETVFSHFKINLDGSVESKIDKIRELQDSGYFVVLLFVGLSNSALSIARVATRVAQGGHAIAHQKLQQRFPKTQKAVRIAASIADATIMVDNSRSTQKAFTVCRVQLRDSEEFDIRRSDIRVPRPILAWLNVLSP